MLPHTENLKKILGFFNCEIDNFILARDKLKDAKKIQKKIQGDVMMTSERRLGAKRA